jgi:chitodextrinase
VIGVASKIGKQVVPANSIGPTGFLKAEFLFSTSDPVATVQFALGANTGTPAPFFAANVAAPSATGRAVLYSRTASKQVYPDYQDFGFGQGVNAAGEIAIDTTIDRTFYCYGWISGANDYLVLEATTVITQA